MIETNLAAYLESHRNEHLDQLCEWLRIPSVSTLAEHRKDVIAAARWLAAHFQRIGLDHVQLVSTDGHPLVLADWRQAAAGSPTVLIYGHYDVQPVDPLEQWHSPPFEPQQRGDKLYARGASDDKGQVFALVTALEAMLAVRGSLPVNVTLLVEGEEEVGSTSLARHLQDHGQALAADVCLVADTPMVATDRPSISYGLRGAWAAEIVVRGPSSDLHSGAFGGVVHNPAQALAELLATLHDPQGRVAVDGFYDDVAMLDPGERQRLALIPHDDTRIRAETGVPALYGEPGFTPVERIGTRPTLEINGMWGGFIGDGFKTVIPAEAQAKISCRLVPDQDPARIGSLVTNHLKRHCPPTVTVEVTQLVGAPAVLVDTSSPAMRAAVRAYELGFGTTPLLSREGGGIPVVTLFQDLLGAQVVLMGLGLPDDHTHAPNERLHLPNLHRGIRTAIHFLDELAAELAEHRR